MDCGFVRLPLHDARCVSARASILMEISHIPHTDGLGTKSQGLRFYYRNLFSHKMSTNVHSQHSTAWTCYLYNNHITTPFLFQWVMKRTNNFEQMKVLKLHSIYFTALLCRTMDEISTHNRKSLSFPKTHFTAPLGWYGMIRLYSSNTTPNIQSESYNFDMYSSMISMGIIYRRKVNNFIFLSSKK